MHERHEIGWDQGSWLNEPPEHRVDGAALLMTTGAETDFWRTTGYGFVHDNGHALLTPLPVGAAVEVSFVAAFDHLYDQAGVLVRVDETTWTKAGIEFTDGVAHLGAVVTSGRSDWSLAPVPEWGGCELTVRVSRAGDALTVRARRGAEPWRMVRFAPLAPDAAAMAGPFCCSPLRAGLRVRFTGFRTGPADAELHATPPPA